MPNLFFSGSDAQGKYQTRTYNIITHRLLSLHKDYLKEGYRTLEAMMEKRSGTDDVEILLDSGAFTAWTKQQPDIDVQQLLKMYRDFYRKYSKYFKNIYYINLDKIPGTKGVSPTDEDIVEALRVSDDNFKILSAEFGNNVLPVFHMTEPRSRLHEVASMNPDYICLSPRQGIANKERLSWVQRVHVELRLHNSKVETHGLATTGTDIMLNVPWRSVDSSSWVQYAAFGWICFPYKGNLATSLISKDSPARKLWGRHMDTMMPEMREFVKNIADQLGIEWDELREDYGARMLLNAWGMQTMSQQNFRDVPVQSTLMEL